ncbi:MAG: YraN family protein [bacterium]|nr:YraN family protein [bacterium]
MAITEKRSTGDKGEEIACTFLVKQGFKIIERNHWRKWGEIDIVASSPVGKLKDIVYHFIEVKTAIRDLSRGEIDEDYSPADNMTKEKRARLSRVIQTYIVENRLGESDWQVDVALVYLDKYSDKFKIEVLEDIDL